nr:hypothetical protein [Candidatus Sigynarchaeota archaeon]
PKKPKKSKQTPHKTPKNFANLSPGGVPVPPPPEGHVAQYLRDSSGQDARADEGVERPLEGRGPWGARGASVFAEQNHEEQKDY